MSLSTSSITRGGNTMRRVLIAVAIIAAFGLGLVLRGGGDAPTSNEVHGQEDHAAETTWTCSMHPHIKLPKPGKCPICFMDLIPLDSGGDEEGLSPSTLVLSESAAALAEIQTAVVERRRAKARVRLIGKVDFDETLYKSIAAWVPGRIDTLFVDFTGTEVKRGQRLVSLYSPELYAAQTELLNAIQANRDLQASRDSLMRSTAAATVTSARERLRLWGLDSARIRQIEQSGQARHHMDITSPLGGVVIHKKAVEGMYVKTGSPIYTVADLSRVWVTLDAYESDLVWLKEGQNIDFSVEAVPGRRFQGTITFIDPVLNNRTRTTMVRLNVDNSERLLKPGMFVNANVEAEVLGGHAGQDGGNMPLVIPASAPLITGKRAVVYVRLPESDKPAFEGREVVLGPRAGDSYIVISGLSEGEQVVTKGNFKIDSALQIQAKPSMMNPTGGGPVPGHNHGGSPARGTSSETMEMPSETGPTASFDAPEEFRAQLGAVLKSYLNLQAALAADDQAAAGAAAGSAGDALSAVDMTLVDGEGHMAWMKDEKLLRDSFAAVAGAAGIEVQREHLLGLTGQLWNTLRRFGYSQDDPVRLFNCPMADGGNGGDWIQLETTTANPYFGAAMLLCGDQTDSLVTSESRKEG